MKLFALFLAFLLLISCGPKEETEVSWPSLNELENLSLTINKASDSEQKALLKQAGSLITELNSSIPKNAQNKDQIKVLLQDLSTLTPKLSKVDTLSTQEVGMLSQAISPIVTKLMTASGIPHRCSSCASCGGHSSESSEKEAP